MKQQQKIFLNNKGVALVMVLILSLISLAIMAALVYMITASTQISGLQQRYKNATEAGKGGAAVAFQAIAAGGDPNFTGLAINFTTFYSSACMNAKLNSSTYSSDGSYGWGACGTSATAITNATTMNIDPVNNSDSYDMSFDLGTFPTYRIYSKIVDTVEGNSSRYVDATTNLLKTGVVSANSGEVPVVPHPYLYSIEIKAVNTSNTAEKADYSVLYEY